MKKAMSRRRKRRTVLAAVSAAAVVFASAALIYDALRYGHHSEKAGETETSSPGLTDGTDMNLGDGIFITGIGSYSGAYMEDGSNETVSGILMLTVENRSEKTLRYGEIRLSGKGTTANFSVSTLPPQGSAVLLELNRQKYVSEGEFSYYALENKIFFDGALSLCEDRIQIGCLDGKLNITNISGKDMEGDVVIYYKNYIDGIYYGGITYRTSVSGGLLSGEIRQVSASHCSAAGSAVMFVTCP